MPALIAPLVSAFLGLFFAGLTREGSRHRSDSLRAVASFSVLLWVPTLMLVSTAAFDWSRVDVQAVMPLGLHLLTLVSGVIVVGTFVLAITRLGRVNAKRSATVVGVAVVALFGAILRARLPRWPEGTWASLGLVVHPLFIGAGAWVTAERIRRADDGLGRSRRARGAN